MMVMVVKTLIADVSEMTAVIFVRQPVCFCPDLLPKHLRFREERSKPMGVFLNTVHRGLFCRSHTFMAMKLCAMCYSN